MANRIQLIILAGQTVNLGPDITSLATKDYVDGKAGGISDVSTRLAALKTQLETITGDGKSVTAALDTFNEIKAFLDTYTNQDDLVSLLSTLKSDIEAEIPTDNASLSNGAGYLVQNDLTDYAKTSDIPTDNSSFTNGAGYMTTTAADLKYADKNDIPTDISELNNNTGYITSSALTDYAKIEFITNSSEATDATKIYFVFDTDE